MPRRLDPEMDKKKSILPAEKPKPLTDEMRKLISKERDAELREEVEIAMDARLAREAEAARKEELEQEFLREKQPDRAYRKIYVDLPPEAPYILINGTRCFYPNTEYEVDKALYDTLNEIMWRSWQNEAQRLDDKTANQYRRKLNKVL